MGHSRGGAMAMLGAQTCPAGRPNGWHCTLGPSVGPRFKVSARCCAWSVEILRSMGSDERPNWPNPCSPFRLYADTMQRAEELSVERAAKATSCPILVIHGTLDPAVHHSEESSFRNGHHKAHSSPLPRQTMFLACGTRGLMPGIGQHILKKHGIASAYGWNLASDWHVPKPLGIKSRPMGVGFFNASDAFTFE